MSLLFGTFLFSIASALLPILNIEAYVAVVAQVHPNVVVSAIAAVGQMVGKIVWYYGGAHADRVPWLQKKMNKPKALASREKWEQRIHGRPVFTTGILFSSAFLGLPPYAVIATLAGVLRVNLVLFVVTGLVGRFLRFLGIGAIAISLVGGIV